MRKKGGSGGIAGARAEIGRIDAGLLRLLNRRAAVVAKLHARKALHKKPFYDAARTDAILDRLLRLNKGPLRDEQVLALFTFLLHHFALGHRPGPPPARPPRPWRRREPPLFFAQLAPGADPAILRRHGISRLPKGRLPRDLVDARDRRTRVSTVLAGLLEGARGAILEISGNEDDEALADLCHRAKLLWLALRRGEAGGR